jgi:hypothetical protein
MTEMSPDTEQVLNHLLHRCDRIEKTIDILMEKLQDLEQRLQDLEEI